MKYQKLIIIFGLVVALGGGGILVQKLNSPKDFVPQDIEAGAASGLQTWLLTNDARIYPTKEKWGVVIGDTATTSPDSKVEIKGQLRVRGDIYATSTAQSVHASGTAQ